MKDAERVEIKNIIKTFVTKERTVHAVNDINIDIEPGELVCLLGPSGCGKTTLLRMIAGFETPTSGSIIIGDSDIAYLPPNKRNTAMVFQNYALFPHMNVFDNIAYGLKLRKLDKQEVEKRVNEILELMKMEELAFRVPSQMSGGQQQRVSLARALVVNAGVLLLDEPLSNLDAKLRIHMRDEIRRIQQEFKITSIYVTHDQAEAMALADKIVIMKDGLVMQIGSPKEIYQKPNNEFVAKFIGRANIIKAKVIEKNANSTKLEVFGVEYTIPEAVDKNVGEEIEVVVRPESLDITGNNHSGKVIKSVFMGETHEYEVDINGEVLELALHDPYNKEIKGLNEMLAFSFDTSTMHILKQ